MPERIAKGCVHCGRKHGWNKSKSHGFDDALNDMEDCLNPESSDIVDTVPTEEKEDFFVSPPAHSRWVLVDLEEALAEHQRRVKDKAEAKKNAKAKAKKLWGAIWMVVRLASKKDVDEVSEPHPKGKVD